ncbi:MAG: hypothetical protein K0U64_02595 [Actinomycetia bacterium]|nr:hypothetical protein [Actinomycetes bacterium]
MSRRDATGPIRCIEAKRVTLGATHPGDNTIHLTDALRVLADRVSHDGASESVECSDQVMSPKKC